MTGLLVLFAVAALLITVAGTAAMWRAIRRPVTKGYAWCLANGWPAEPGDLGVAGEEVTMQLTQGSSTVGYVLDGRDPDGPLVVLAHGHSASRHYSLGMAGPVVEAASRVVLFDMPGHGDADRAACTLGVREPADIHRIVEQFDDGTRPVVLFGSSMGGFSALGTVARFARGRVAGLVLLGVFRYGHEPIAGTMRSKGYPVWPFLPLVTAWHHLTTRGEVHDRVEDAQKVDCPTLLLHFEVDPLCPLASAEAIAEAIPESTLHVFPGEGHTEAWRSEPEAYAAQITAFLGRFRKA